jgi:hypothetical protein
VRLVRKNIDYNSPSLLAFRRFFLWVILFCPIRRILVNGKKYEGKKRNH